ncbi:sensor histidine kinase [Luteitalea sp.]|jgi:two-component system sensor histidine kinase RegB|uniref:sensor histidine kinase n=1 Tax=Luteitalea sp. TaxID=2004800 RepID=UPI0037C81970
MPGSSARPSSVVLPWLVRLRWVSLALMLGAAVAASRWWTVRLPWPPLLALMMAMAATNVALTLQLRARAPRRVLVGGVLLLDVGVITGLIALAGGPINPFGTVYLVSITIAAATLGLWWSAAVALASTIGFGLTFVRHRPLDFADPLVAGRVLSLHLWGMWVALAAAAGLIAYFVSRMSEALDERERALAEARSAAARSDRLAALLALGAGAAHELATPLNTISILAGEIGRVTADGSIAPADAVTEVATHAALVRDEVERCTRVLDQMTGRALALDGAAGPLTLDSLVEGLRHRLDPSSAGRLDVTVPVETVPVTIPAEPLRQVLLSLLRNAFDASAPSQRVALEVTRPGGRTRFTVVDTGTGMRADVAARAGDPFFTTKPGSGNLGLGLFLARAFADQIGGRLELESRVGVGTTVTLDLPTF